MNLRAKFIWFLVVAALLVPFSRVGASTAAARPSSVVAAQGFEVIVGDFNGDSRDDVLAYAPGEGSDRLLYGTPFGFAGGPSVSVSGEYLPVVGDFNGDHKADVLWYDPFHRNHSSVWFGAATGFAHGQPLDAPLPTATDVYVPTVGDFDGDGRADIVWGNVGPGARHVGTKGSPVWYGGASGFTVNPVPLATVPCKPRSDCFVLAGDYNGDGHDDLIFYRAADQADKLVYSKGRGFVNNTHISVSGTYGAFTGDFDGDGKADVFWYAAGSAHDHLWYGKVHGFLEPAAISISGSYIPVVGDFDADGNSDIVWYAPGSQHDYLRYGKATLFRDGPSINVNGTYAPAVGDFNGDDKADIVWAAPAGHDSPVWYGAASGFASGAPVAL